MTVTTTRTLAMGVCAAWPAIVAASAAAQTPFLGRTDAVIVDVTVRQGTGRVTDLSPSEFRVLDDGVPQHVAFAPARDVPLDLWILTDTSSTYSGASAKAAFPAHIRAAIGLLRQGDRVAVYSLADPLDVVVPLSDARSIHLPPMPLHGSPRIVDGIADALIMPGVAGRRHVVMIQWPGFDAVSQTTAERLAAIAVRSDAEIDVVYSNQDRTSAVLRPVLDEAARSSGGGVFKASGLEAAVRQVLASLEHAYVLTYTATGVPRQGWHTVDVSLTRPGKFTIGARRGYFVQ